MELKYLLRICIHMYREELKVVNTKKTDILRLLEQSSSERGFAWEQKRGL